MRYSLALVLLLVASTASAERLYYRDITVFDGDTIRVAGTIYRLVDFDAPETRTAKCEVENAMGVRATQRLRQMIAKAGYVDLTEVRCSCKPGTHGTLNCNHGRSCGRLSVDGQDVGLILIHEGLARPLHCSAESCPKQKQWC